MYTIQSLLKNKISEFGDKLYIFEKVDEKYQGKTYGQFVKDVYSFANYLQQQNLVGKKIALYAKNSYAYMVSDIAVMGFVGISVCISKDWSARDLNNVIEQLDLDAILYGKEQAEHIDKLRDLFPQILYIPVETAIDCSATIECTKDLINPNECSKIIFSSGTTGTPKAVMLSQNNMFACWENLYKRVPLNHTDVNYLFLPLHHAYAGICVSLYSLITGMKIYMCSSIDKMIDEMREVQPTVFCAVPLIYERVYAICQATNISPSKLLGGNMRYMFCGGAWFDPKVREFFKSNGIDIMHSYGLSETSSIVCVDYPQATDFNSVGTVFENTEVKILNPNEEGVGEIIVQGNNVFLGYYNNLQATSKAFDSEGFFHTGDLGRLNGNLLYVYGRIKKVIVLSNGENVYADEIVSLLMKNPGVTSAKVYEKNKKIFATIFCNTKIDANEVIELVNEQLPKYSHIQEFEVVDDSISVRMK